MRNSLVILLLTCVVSCMAAPKIVNGLTPGSFRHFPGALASSGLIPQQLPSPTGKGAEEGKAPVEVMGGQHKDENPRIAPPTIRESATS
jgi:hypothetical protein